MKALLAAWAPVIAAQPLDTLLQRMTAGPAVQAAGAEQRQLRTERQRRANERGWTLFGGLDGGSYRELERNADTDQYTGYGAELGLRYPLLGTLRRRTEAVIEAELAVTQQQHTQALRRIQQRLRLRNAYIDWWEAQRIAALCSEVNELARQELATVRKRAQAKGLRQSEEMLLRQRWSSQRRSCNEYAQRTPVLRNRVSRIAGNPINPGARAEAEPLPVSPKPIAHWSELIRKHPLVASRRSALKSSNRLRPDRWYHAIEANFALSQRLDRRDDINGTGSGLAASLSFEVPLASVAGGNNRDTTTTADDAARLRLAETRQELKEDLGRALRRYRASLDEVRYEIGQVELTQRIATERAARADIDTRAGFMALRRARLERAQASFNLIRAWANAWREQSELHLLGDRPQGLSPPLGNKGKPWPGYTASHSATPVDLQQEGSSPSNPWNQAVYVWNSQPLLSETTRERELAALRQAGINRIYLGLSANQVANLDRVRPALKSLIRDARDKGITTDLLLGEPSWIEPEHRQDLVALLARLEGIPFDRLHLDLEVEQLGWPVPQPRLRHWMRTVEAARNASPWPLNLVSHHRWFAPKPSGEVCIPCRVSEIGINHVSLMIYTSNAERSTTLAKRIARAWPTIQFKLAQSLEPSLPPANSWHGTPPPKLVEMNANWANKLSPAGILGLEWQDWTAHPLSGAKD
ncbi:hypothetical protein ACMDCT_13270 [Halomonadaceae bacterium KBTZ08]